MTRIGLYTLLLILFSFGTASAAFIDEALPDNAFITIDGYDVAWISPVDEVNIDLTFQSQFGWQFMTQDIFDMLGIDAYDFVFDGANVDYETLTDPVSGAYVATYGYDPGGDIAVATPYFSDLHYHIDFNDGVNGLWNFTGDSWVLETLAYRESASAPVPEPSTWLLLGTGLAGLAFYRRKKG